MVPTAAQATTARRAERRFKTATLLDMATRRAGAARYRARVTSGTPSKKMFVPLSLTCQNSPRRVASPSLGVARLADTVHAGEPHQAARVGGLQCSEQLREGAGQFPGQRSPYRDELLERAVLRCARLRRLDVDGPRRGVYLVKIRHILRFGVVAGRGWRRKGAAVNAGGVDQQLGAVELVLRARRLYPSGQVLGDRLGVGLLR